MLSLHLLNSRYWLFLYNFPRTSVYVVLETSLSLSPKKWLRIVKNKTKQNTRSYSCREKWLFWKKFYKIDTI